MSPAFTLVEMLVAVAIVALLVAVLVTSLARAREKAKQVVCQSNIRQLTMAFLTYSVENRWRLPAGRHDFGADWLGWHNQAPPNSGRQPYDGTIYRYVKNREVYTCPSDNPDIKKIEGGSSFFSYAAHAVLIGARIEHIEGAHYPDGHNYGRDDHTHNMKPFDGAPMLIEGNIRLEQYPSLTGHNDCRWVGFQSMADRHELMGYRTGGGHIGFTDGHVGIIQVPKPPQHEFHPFLEAYYKENYFYADNTCIRTGGGKWVTSRSVNPNVSSYGMVHFAPPAHAGEQGMYYPPGGGEQPIFWDWEPIEHLTD